MGGSNSWELLEKDRRTPSNHLFALDSERDAELAKRRTRFIALTPDLALKEMDLANPRETRMGADDLLKLLVERSNDGRLGLNEVWQHCRFPRDDR